MTPLRRLTIAVAVGIPAGAGGVAVTLVLHGTQHVLFGYDSGTFLPGIEAAPRLAPDGTSLRRRRAGRTGVGLAAAAAARSCVRAVCRGHPA